MRFPTVQGSNQAIKTVSVRNTNAANTFIDGRPVYYDPTGTYEVDCKSIEETGVSTILAGIYKGKALNVGEWGEAVCYGFTEANVLRNTRTGSDAAWASIPAIAVGDVLDAVTSGYLSRAGAGSLTDAKEFFVAGQTAASATTLASTVGGTALVSTARMKVFVRAM